MNYKTARGESVRLVKSIGEGGEGCIWSTNSGKVAKIYNNETLKENKDIREKIEYMCSDQPSPWILEHTAWPREALYDDSGKFAGFLMTNFDSFRGIGEMYSFYLSGFYPDKTPVNQVYKVALAAVLAQFVEEMHAHNRIIGDFNPRNLGYRINPNSDVPVNLVFFDTDSFPIMTRNGRLFKCKVSYPGFTAPELIKAFDDKHREFLSKGITRDVYYDDIEKIFDIDTDIFALGIHIFRLLMNGFHPYLGVSEKELQKSMESVKGKYHPSDRTVKTADLNSAVYKNDYCMKPGWKHENSACLMRQDIPDYIASLFDRTFKVLKNGEHRPLAKEWREALMLYISSLKSCSDNSNHVYWKNLPYCPYCSASKRCRENLYKKDTSSSPSKTTLLNNFNQPSKNPSGSSPLENAVFTIEGGKRKWR